MMMMRYVQKNIGTWGWLLEINVVMHSLDNDSKNLMSRVKRIEHF